jgi:hypothetical protein
MFIMARKILVKDNHVNIEVPYDTTTWHDMFDDFNNDLGMSVKIECNEHTNWYPTIYVYDNEDFSGDYIHKYIFFRQLGVANPYVSPRKNKI